MSAGIGLAWIIRIDVSMARKSQKLRLSQAKELVTSYESADLKTDRAYRFLCDVTARMERGKYPTKRQRDWLDALITEGVPVPKGDLELLVKIDAALKGWADNASRTWEVGALGDFRHRVYKGWKLSEKQEALMAKLLKRFEDDESGVNFFTPTADQLRDLENLTRLYCGYTSFWRAERPAVAKSIERVKAFLSGSGTIEEYHWNKLNRAMGSRLRTLHTPRFSAGMLGFVTAYTAEMSPSIGSHGTSSVGRRSHVATALTDAYVDDKGRVVNDWLVPSGAVKPIAAKEVSKRREK